MSEFLPVNKQPKAEGCSHCSCGHTESGDVVTMLTTDAPIAAGSGLISRFRINEMDCPTEEALIRKKLAGWPGLHTLQFDLMQRCLTVQHEPAILPAIKNAILELGMTPQAIEDSATTSETEPKGFFSYWKILLAALLAITAEVLHFLALPEALVATIAFASVALSGGNTYKKGWIAVKHLDFNINALMSIAVTGALFLQQWPEAAAVMCLFTLAEMIEAKSLDRARKSVQALMSLSPETCEIKTASGWQTVNTKQAAISDVVRIKAGEKIPLDGKVSAGNSSVDQSAISGESIPVEKTLGDPVYAGTLNGSGVLEIIVSAASTDTTLAKIIKTIQEAQATRAPMQRFVDQFARIYTPVILVLAALVAVVPPLFLSGLWPEWIYKALVLLVIACPCALVISTPVTIVSGIAAAARRGILIKGGVYLEKGRLLNWLAFDKTGTITSGQPVQTDATVFTTDAESRIVAASLAEQSTHPISQAIYNAARADKIGLAPVQNMQNMPGVGVKGIINSQLYQLGNRRLIRPEIGVSAEVETVLHGFERQGKTTVLLFKELQAVAIFAVADAIKASSRNAITALHQLGIKTLMLTGDNSLVAKSIAQQVGIDEVRANQLPEDKRSAILEKKAQKMIIGMVGDGVNDAPALAQADIGFAMGIAGSAAALETADVAIMDDNLNKISDFVHLSRATHRILVQNIVLALAIKLAFFVLTLLGLGTMWMAVFADMGTSLIVVANGLRLLRHFKSV